MNSEQIILQKIIQAGFLNEGDQICYQNEQGTIHSSDDIIYYQYCLKQSITRLVKCEFYV